MKEGQALVLLFVVSCLWPMAFGTSLIIADLVGHPADAARKPKSVTRRRAQG
jgi:hypothetical protein